jgi:dTDP-glucose 4,6-dehydratase
LADEQPRPRSLAQAVHALGGGEPSHGFDIDDAVGRNERTNLHVVETICCLLDEMAPRAAGPRRKLISFVIDRPGHDRRYAIDASKLERELGWKAEENFETGIAKTVRWYLDQQPWWNAILKRGYIASRVGLNR